jgi:hypothetical protein
MVVAQSDPSAACVGPADAGHDDRRAVAPKRVLLFFPVFAHVYPRAFENFLRLVSVASRVCTDYVFDTWVVERASLVSAMNRAVEAAQAQGHHAIIAFDDDCLPLLSEFPVGDARRFQVIPRLLALLEHHPILSGVGYMRGYPHTTTVGLHYDHGMSMVIGKDDRGHESLTVKGFHWVDDIDAPEYVAKRDPNGLLEVDFCGVPIMAIRRDVWERIPAPLFETRDHLGRASTHDIYFCNKAKAHGFAIKVDTHIDCGHIVEAPIVNKDTKKALERTMVSA